MAEYHIDPEIRYYNYQGRFPPLPMEHDAAPIPPVTDKTHPKLITDTTLRDGAQDPHFALFPVDARLAYFDLLHELDNCTGAIEQIEVFIYQQRDLWALERLLEREYEFPQVTTWTRAIPKDIKDLVEVSRGSIKETGMLASSSDHHIIDKLKYRSKAEAVEKYLAPILTACENGIRPRIHLEDTTKADIFGFVIPFMQRVLDETDNWAKFRICDTIGWGSPDPYAPLPVGIPRLISTLVQETGAELEFHGHNDFGMATANSMAALRYGCRRVNVAFAGLGERTGNTAWSRCWQATSASTATRDSSWTLSGASGTSSRTRCAQYRPSSRSSARSSPRRPVFTRPACGARTKRAAGPSTSRSTPRLWATRPSSSTASALSPAWTASSLSSTARSRKRPGRRAPTPT